jgi:BCCT family betaine/carnitine transporter
MKTDKWNISLIAMTIIISLSISSYVLINPELSAMQLNSLYQLAAKFFESAFQYGSLLLVAFLLMFALSKKGAITIKLKAKDEYPFFTWIMMLFAAGMGASIMFWSPIEWAYYLNEPPFGLENFSQEHFAFARTYSNFHWGLTGWAIFCLPALAFAISLNKNPDSKLTFSGIFFHQTQSNLLRLFGWLLDLIFILSIISGAGIAIGLSFPLIAQIFSSVLSIEATPWFEGAILLLCLAIFTTSVALGLNKGIKRLSQVNIFLIVNLLIFVLVFGPTQQIFYYSLESLGILVTYFIRMSTYTGDSFVQNWTVFYWAWWMALAPFVGAFIVNISNGKTLRQLIFGTIFIGAIGCMLHFMILGNYSFILYENNILDIPQLIGNGESNQAIIQILETLPGGNLPLILYGIVMIIFLCTTYDSCVYVLASSSMKSMSHSPDVFIRIIFALILVIQPALFLVVDGLEVTKNILLLCSIPLLGIFLAMMIYSVKHASADK